LSKTPIATEAATVRRLVARFAGKLAVHASMENEALYPRLLDHADTEVRLRARALFDEVGTIYGSFDAYVARWPSASSIELAPSEFVDQTRDLLNQLAVRMTRENNELYPLVDA